MKKFHNLSPLIFFIQAVLLPGSVALARTYTTMFPLSENPISEEGSWVNGGTAGLDWTNVATSSGLALGTMDGQVNYADSTALLTGTWGSNQTATATVLVGTRPNNNGIWIELEFRFDSSLSAHVCNGYECNFSMAANADGPYAQIVRWNGALGDFTELNGTKISQLSTGDIVSATITNSGGTIYINNYINGTLVLSATDTVGAGGFDGGAPGIGMYSQGTSVNDSGFTQFSATDGITPLAAGFAGGPTNGISPLTVVFTNLSSGATSYAWAFGDGQTSTSVNPSNAYTNPGSYSVSLTAVGPGGTNALTMTNYIAVAAPPPILSAHITNGQFNLLFDAVAGQSYSIQQNTNLITTNWIKITNFVGAGSLYQFSTPATNTPPGLFYRVGEP